MKRLHFFKRSEYCKVRREIPGVPRDFHFFKLFVTGILIEIGFSCFENNAAEALMKPVR